MMASYPSPPADPLQSRNSEDSAFRPPVVAASSPTNCKLYELIANPDEDSELKKLCEEDDDSAICGSSLSKVSGQVVVLLDDGNNYSEHSSEHCSENSTTTVLQSCSYENKFERKKRGERLGTKSESHYHPYARSNSPKLTTHRPVMKSCTDLRSTAPVLYDLLSDDCDTENHDRSDNISRNTLPEPNLNLPPENSLLRPLTVQMPYVPSPGLPVLPSISQFPASYISSLLQQNLLQSYPSVNLLKTAQAPSYLEDLPSVAPILPSVLRDVLAFDDDAKKPMPLL